MDTKQQNANPQETTTIDDQATKSGSRMKIRTRVKGGGFAPSSF